MHLGIVESCMYFQYNYDLRKSNMTYRIPILKTTSHFNSFLPSTINAWNELPQDNEEWSSVTSYISNLSKKFPKKNKLIDYGPRRENIIHCQLRNRASKLNPHLSEDSLIEDPFCQYCGNSYEDDENFFSCPKYAIQREIILYTVHNLPIPVSVEILFYYMEVINVTLLLINKYSWCCAHSYKKIHKIITIVRY